MKKKNQRIPFAALCLALAFFTPNAVAACGEHEISAPSQSESSVGGLPPENSEETPSEDTSEPTLPEEDVQTPPVQQPQTPSQPSQPSAPVQPETPSQPETPVVKTAQYIRCTGENVNVRAGAGTSFAVLGQAEKGTTYAVIGKTGNWYKTYYKNQTAYLYAEYASVFALEKTESETEDVIEEGYKLIGTPYVYGAVRLHDGKGNLLKGFSVKKFDCSSLIQYIFYKGAGKILDVNTRTQVKQGKYVKPADLQRGDCIFFTNEERQYNTGVERIGHVALYLGNDYILHTASDYARIEKMSAKRWSYYVEARRFL